MTTNKISAEVAAIVLYDYYINRAEPHYIENIHGINRAQFTQLEQDYFSGKYGLILPPSCPPPKGMEAQHRAQTPANYKFMRQK